MTRTNPSPFDGFLAPAAFAEKAGASTATVLAWIRNGQLPAVRLGRLTLIPEDAVRRILEARGGLR